MSSTVKDLAANPPVAITTEVRDAAKKKRKPRAKKGSGPKSKKPVTKKSILGTPSKASFKRRAKGAKLSPLVKSVRKKALAKNALASSPSASASVTPSVPPASVTPPARALDDSEPGTSTWATLEDLVDKLQKLGVPPELFPTVKPMGLKSYTIRSLKNPCSIQVLHQKCMYWITKDSEGKVPACRSIQWHAHGGASEAWEHAKSLIGW